MRLFHLATFACVATAAVVEERAVANNNCGRAVAGTAKGAAFRSSVKADCVANVVIRTTVLVTPSVSTVFRTSTAQASLQSTLIATSTSTSIATVTSFTTQTEVSVAAQFSTSVQDTIQTNQVPYIATYTSTAVSAVTLGSASTVTVYTAVNSPVKRAAQTIPAYASACRSFEEYGSACALVGVAPGPTTIYSTLPASTVTSTVSRTSTSTSFLTSTLVSGLNIIISELSTQTTVQTVTTTLATIVTSTQTAFSTSTISTSTVIETVTSQVPAAVQTVYLPIPTFKVQMQPVNGGSNLYLQIKTSDAQSIIGVTDSSVATTFTINSLSEMYATTNSWVACGFIPQANYYMEMVSRASIANYPNYFRPLSCSIVGGTNELVCQFGNVQNFTLYNNQFFYSKPSYNGYAPYRGFIVPI